MVMGGNGGGGGDVGNREGGDAGAGAATTGEGSDTSVAATDAAASEPDSTAYTSFASVTRMAVTDSVRHFPSLSSPDQKVSSPPKPPGAWESGSPSRTGGPGATPPELQLTPAAEQPVKGKKKKTLLLSNSGLRKID